MLTSYSFHALRQDLLLQLRQSGIEANEARAEVDLIVQFASGFSLARQLLERDHPVPAAALARINAIAAQRMRRVPLQYCLGEAWFMGLRFEVGPGVLIPRADTETLVEQALALLPRTKHPVVLDIGTGSGAIAISVLHLRPDATAYAVDISERAIAIAKRNAELNGVGNRLDVVHTDWSAFTPDVQFDAVLCNPPYVPLSLEHELQPEVSRFEPAEAVFGLDEDGLGFYRKLSVEAARFLNNGGFMMVEVGQGQDRAVEDMLKIAGWKLAATVSDLNKIPRVVTAFRADQDY